MIDVLDCVVGVWGECGDSVAYPRVNATDPFPPSCTWSSSQYRCSVHCCVPTWEGAGWTSAQSGFFPAPGASTSISPSPPKRSLAEENGEP